MSKKIILKIEDVRAYETNPRKIPVKAIDAVAKSIELYGIQQPIVVDRNNVIVVGHTRFEACKQLGKTELRRDKEVPEWAYAKDANGEWLSEELCRAYRIADNKTNEGASWNDELLRAELERISFELPDFDLSDLTGFNESKIQTRKEVEGEDDTPDERTTDIKSGDVFALGEHRLVCGDATQADVVATLMEGARAVACITDPPYSVGYENLKRKPDAPTRKEKGDVYEDPPADMILNFIEHIPSDVLVMTYPVNKHFHLLSQKTSGWDLLYDCVWVKHHFAFIMGRNYQPRHEPILIFRKHKGKSVFNVPTNQSTIFEFDKPAKNIAHPTIKPVALYEMLVEYHTNANDVVYEPFGGSGTTLIACEKMKRRCYAVEIKPEYCQLIIDRYKEFTGRDDVRKVN